VGRATGRFESIEDYLEHVCVLLDLPVVPPRIAEAARLRFDLIRRALAPQEGAVETMEKLKAGGRRVGLISNASPEVPVLWPETPFAALIEAPVFSCVAGARKPDPRLYDIACERLGVKPSECVYVGDGDCGELGAATAKGMRAFQLRMAGREPGYQIEPEQWDGARIASLPEVLDRI
jgi:putative hydrolase of the HAD superfamily